MFELSETVVNGWGNTGADQCSGTVRQHTDNSVGRTFDFRIRQVVAGVYFLCFRLRQLCFGRQIAVFRLFSG